MRILITGGCGFIGSNFIRHILDKYKDYKICNLDKLTYAGNLENLKDLETHPRYKFVRGDICNKKLVFDIMKHSNAVINFAAETHVDNSIKDSNEFINTNIKGTQTLLDAAKLCNIRRFIQISTDEVYGSTNKPSKEEDTLEPNSPYAASKASADMLARAYNVTFKVPTVITRSSNNFGPYQHPEKLIPLFTTNLLSGKKVPLYGDGLNVRDWMYVIDNCEALDLILHQGETGHIYNLGGGNEKTNFEITKLILRELGRDDSCIEFVKDRLGHDRKYSLNTSKIRKMGWKPKHSFESALKETISWYRENRKWWLRLKP
ncbi:dTDP-glucose 4,6-dehydratase [Candidatus Woesearchaeota archaeon]|nr:dTDP-glucose 4,6-dehydratase [Candidatus Woesearchaeota archaeon]